METGIHVAIVEKNNILRVKLASVVSHDPRIKAVTLIRCHALIDSAIINYSITLLLMNMSEGSALRETIARAKSLNPKLKTLLYLDSGSEQTYRTIAKDIGADCFIALDSTRDPGDAIFRICKLKANN